MQAVNNVISASQMFNLPEILTEKATWLACGDDKAAERLLRAAEEDEARMRTSYLEAEFKRIQLLFQNIEHTQQITHNISLPQGDMHVTCSKNKFIKCIVRR